jgi:hypothetical protein
VEVEVEQLNILNWLVQEVLVEVELVLKMVQLELDGTANTGGGGGGGTGNNVPKYMEHGGAGGKGVVILAMPLANFSTQQLVLQQNQMMEQLQF